jgi:hypothetical protein
MEFQKTVRSSCEYFELGRVGTRKVQHGRFLALSTMIARVTRRLRKCTHNVPYNRHSMNRSYEGYINIGQEPFRSKQYLTWDWHIVVSVCSRALTVPLCIYMKSIYYIPSTLPITGVELMLLEGRTIW